MRNLRLPELDVGTFSSPFRKKQSQQVCNENCEVTGDNNALTRQLVKTRAFKPRTSSFINDGYQCKKGQAPKSQRMPLRDALNTIEVDELPYGKPTLRTQKTPKGESASTRRRSLSNECGPLPPIGEQSAIKRSPSSFDEKYPTQKGQDNSGQTPAKTKTGRPIRRRSSLLNELAHFPNDYQAFIRYLQQNCLSLETVIKQKLLNHTYLRQKVQQASQSQPLKIMH